MMKAARFLALALVFALVFSGRSVAAEPAAGWSFEGGTSSVGREWSGQLIGNAKVEQEPGASLSGNRHLAGGGDGYLQTDFPSPTGEHRMVSVWFRTAPRTNITATLFGWGNDVDRERFDFGLEGDGMQIEIGGSEHLFELDRSVRDGEWHHVLLSQSGRRLEDIRLYVDGSLVGRAEGDAILRGVARPVRIGSGVVREGGIRDFRGRIDDFAVWSDLDDERFRAAVLHGFGRFGFDLGQIRPALELESAPVGARAEIAGSMWEKITYFGGFPGEYGGSIDSNDAFVVINTGQLIRMVPPDVPPLDFNPFEIENDFGGSIELDSGERRTIPLAVSNASSESGEFRMRILGESGEANDLDEVLGRFDSRMEDLEEIVSDTVPFEGGIEGSNIHSPDLGGAQILNRANELATNLVRKFLYADREVRRFGQIEYFTVKSPEMFLFVSDFGDRVTEFDTGGYFIDQASRELFEHRFVQEGREWTAFFTRTTSETGPGVNQVFVTDNPGAVRRELLRKFGMGPAPVLLRIPGRFYYAMFAVTHPGKAETAELFELAEQLVQTGSGPGDRVTVPAATMLEAESAETVELQIDAAGLVPGTYPLILELGPPNPAVEPRTREFVLEVGPRPLRISPESIEETVVIDEPLKTRGLEVRDAAGAPVAWTARLRDGDDMVSLAADSGDAGTSVQIVIDPAGIRPLDTDRFYYVVEITANGVTTLVPVSVDFFRTSIEKMIPDYRRNVVFGIGGLAQAGFLFKIEPLTGGILEKVQVDPGLREVSLSADGDTLYLGRSDPLSADLVDPETLEVLSRHDLEGESRRQGSTLAQDIRIAGVSGGRFAYSDGGNRAVLRLFDPGRDEVVSVFDNQEIPFEQFANFPPGAVSPIFDPISGSLYVRPYVRSGFPESLLRFEVPSAGLEMKEFNLLFDEEVRGLNFTADLARDRFLIGRSTYQLSADLFRHEFFSEYNMAMTAYGEFLIGELGIYSFESGQKIADPSLPSGGVSVVVPDQSGILNYKANLSQSATRLDFFRFPDEVRPKEVGLRPLTPDGAMVPADKAVISWTALPHTEGFRLYLGSDREAVASAVPGSPEDRGIVRATSFELGETFGGGDIFWRVDAVGATEASSEVAQVSIIDLRAVPEQIEVTAPTAAVPQFVETGLVREDGTPLDWTAESDTPWIRLPEASGDAGTPVRIELDPAGLSAGLHVGEVTLGSAGQSLGIPVVFDLFEMDLFRLIADPRRPRVYGLSRADNDGEWRLVDIDSRTGDVLSSRDLSRENVVVEFHRADDRIYYAPRGAARMIRAIDLASGEESDLFRMPENSGVRELISVGAGELHVVATNEASRTLDTSGGEPVETLGIRRNNTEEYWFGRSGQTGYRVRAGWIQKLRRNGVEFEVSENFRLASATETMLRVDANEEILMIGRHVLDSDLREITRLPASGRDVDPSGTLVARDGALAAREGALVWASTGHEIAPIRSEMMVFSGSGDHLIRWDDQEKAVESLAVADFVTLPPPDPIPGAILSVAPESLSWAAVEGAEGYRVYLGGDRDQIDQTDPGEDVLLGTVDGNEVVLSRNLIEARNYFWRVDALTADGVLEGETHHFELDWPAPELVVDGPPPTALSAFLESFFMAIGADRLAVGTGRDLVVHDYDSRLGTVGEPVPVSAPERGELTFLAFPPEENVRTDPGSAAKLLVGYGAGSDSIQIFPTLGRVGLHEVFPGGDWSPTSIHPTGMGESVYSANLFATMGRQEEDEIRIFGEWPDFTELPGFPVPDGSQEFGASISSHGTRFLVTSIQSFRPPFAPGGGFLYEFHAPDGGWRQTEVFDFGELRLGGSAALGRRHAAFGPGGVVGSRGDKVLVFTDGREGWQVSGELEFPRNESFPSSNGEFGRELLVAGDWLFVGAPGDPSHAIGGESTGLIYPYRFDGRRWRELTAIRPPFAVTGFGDEMTFDRGWLFVRGNNDEGDPAMIGYRIDPDFVAPPRFARNPPAQFVAGEPVDFEVAVEFPGDPGSPRILAHNLPAGLSLMDDGDGTARITGTPTDEPGSETWIHLEARDGRGQTAEQTGLATVVGPGQLPELSSMPGQLSVREGGELEIRASAAGASPMEWEWSRNGVIIPDADGPVLTLSEVEAADAGKYRAVVRNVVGATESAEVAVEVVPAGRFGSDWESVRGSNRRHPRLGVELGRHRFEQVWEIEGGRRDSRAGRFSEALVVGDRVIASRVFFNAARETLGMDLHTGEVDWIRDLSSIARKVVPAWHRGVVYLPTHSGISAVDAASGALLWEDDPSSPRIEFPPTLDGDELMVFGAPGRAVRKLDLQGNELSTGFFPPGAEQLPSVWRDRLFTVGGGRFAEYDVDAGHERWAIPLGDSDASEEGRTPVVVDGKALAIPRDDGPVFCIDVDGREILWTASPPEGVSSWSEGAWPVVRDGIVYLNSRDVIHMLSFETGEPRGILDPGLNSGERLNEPLVAFNSHLAASSDARIFVFDPEDGALVQTLGGGGTLSYGNGHLLAAGGDGNLRAFFANAAPEFKEELPSRIDAPPSADDFQLEVGGLTSDADENDPLEWRIASVSRPEIFRTLEIDPRSGDLTVIYNPWESGASQVGLEVRDRAENITSTTLAFEVPRHPEPALELDASPRLNRQTGLLEQSVTVTNTGAREVAGFDFTITGLPDGVTLNNASGQEDGIWEVEHRSPLAAGDSVTLVLEYFAPARRAAIDPEVTADLVRAPASDPVAAEPGLAVDRCVLLDDGVLIEFTATAGRYYEVQYSDDAETWRVSPTRIRAAGNRVQWIDRGPPRTDTVPTDKSARFYRVREIEEEDDSH